LVTAAVFINYIDRGNLATAAPLMQDELHLSASQLGVLLSAFYYGYVVCMPAMGWLAERYGAKRVLAAGVTIWSVATLTTGFAGSFVTLLALARAPRHRRERRLSVCVEGAGTRRGGRSLRGCQRHLEFRLFAGAGRRHLARRLSDDRVRLAPGVHGVRRSVASVALAMESRHGISPPAATHAKRIAVGDDAHNPRFPKS
jgi:hypothetical protein